MNEIKHLDGFTGYKNVSSQLQNDLRALQDYSHQFNLTGNVDVIGETIKRLSEDSFDVAVVGEFNRGKSTIINALMGKSILPMDILPTTATINKITFSVDPYINVEYKDGSNEKIDVEQLQDYVTKLTNESQDKAATIKEATVYYPINYCKNGVTIIDTPGLNDESTMTEVALSILNKVDAAIMVIMSNAPLSESERDLLENKIIASDLGKVMFVVTGIDLVDEDDVERVLTHIKNNITEKIVKKAESIFGQESEEYQAYLRKIGQVRIYGVSAKRALKAKMKGDDSLLERSQFPDFENALEKFLSEDRAAVMLNAPINRIKKSSIEVVKAAQLRVKALELAKEEFEKRYEQATEEIEEIRLKRRQESQRIEQTARDTYDSILPDISQYWTQMKETARSAVDGFDIQGEDIKGSNLESTKTALNNAVKAAMANKSQSLLERIQNQILKSLANEANRLESFEKSFYEATEKIHELFVDPVETDRSTGKDFVIGTAMNSVVMGLGSAVMGYKQAGWKGALVGGATGLGGTAIGAEIALGVLAFVGLPFTFPVLIIGGVLGAICGTLLGKSINDLFFKDTKIKKLKESFKDAVFNELDNMRKTGDFSENLRKQVMEMFSGLETKIREETEAVLSDTQAQLIQLKADIAKNEQCGEDEKNNIAKMIEDINRMCAYANEIEKELTVILSR